MINAIKKMFKTDYENLRGKEFKTLYESTPDAILLDVRTSGEVAQYAINGHHHIDIMNPSFVDEINKLDKNKSYFIYCRSGNRSGQACSYMASIGFTKLYNLSGGVGDYPEN
jgi:rhodanese-related sulfurtransferase